MNCTACGQVLNLGARFCSNCGQPASTPAWVSPPAQRLVRPIYGRMLAGVCAGVAQHFGWDVTPVRLIVLVVVLCGFGSPLIAYIVAWIVIPNEPLGVPYATPAPPGPPSCHP